MDTVLILVLVGITMAAAMLAMYGRPRFRPRFGRGFRPRVVAAQPTIRQHDPTDPADQLRSVMGAEFTARKVMRMGEYRVFRVVEGVLKASPAGRRVFAQTALGELIESKDRVAHSAINSKRVDIVVVDWNGLPLVAVEYQGKGHYQTNAAARDAVKKEALRKAGVQYVEIMDYHSDEDVARLTHEALERAARSTATPTRAETAAVGSRDLPVGKA